MNPTTPRPPVRLLRVNARALAGPSGVLAAPASILLELDPDPRTLTVTLLGAGSPGHVDAHPAAPSARVINRPDSVLLPGLVNAHTHLDLTHIGPQPFDPSRQSFVDWIDLIRTRRALEDDAIRASVERGIALSRRAGTVAIGDIAGAPRGQPSLVPYRTLSESGLLGASFLEFFAIGKGEAPGLERLSRVLEQVKEPGHARVRLSLQPHAPNTVSPAGYRQAIELARARSMSPLSTHLAETREERTFVHDGAGPQRELLERLGLWTDAILADYGKGRTPVEHLAPILNSARFVVAHVNDADAAAIQTLAASRTAVVYCPRASDYFGAPAHFGPHRYLEMRRAGITVALGTDSMVNLPDDGLSILDEMRHLALRDATAPLILLEMATTAGAAALGLDVSMWRFDSPGSRIVTPIAVRTDPANPDPLRAVLEGRGAVEVLSDSIILD